MCILPVQTYTYLEHQVVMKAYMSESVKAMMGDREASRKLRDAFRASKKDGNPHTINFNGKDIAVSSRPISQVSGH